jgi:ribonuclease HI
MESLPKKLILYTDGAAKGNPGLAGMGWLACTWEASESVCVEGYGFLGKTTCNVAEYSAAVMALDYVLEAGVEAILLRADSQLMIRQLEGRYAVKSEILRPLYQRLSQQLRCLRLFQLEHIPRERNVRADALANQAIISREPRRIRLVYSAK